LGSDVLKIPRRRRESPAEGQAARAMRVELEPALGLATTLAPAELPRLIGELAEISAVATARLVRPATEPRPDESLTVQEASKRLVSRSPTCTTTGENSKFTRQEGRKILFSRQWTRCVLEEIRKSRIGEIKKGLRLRRSPESR